jgi:hypothetical protein
MRLGSISLGALAALLLAAGPTHAFHRQTPAIVQITTSGDTDLPRTTNQGRAVVVFIQPDGAGTKVVSVMPHQTGVPQSVGFATVDQQTVVWSGGDNRHPSASGSGKMIVWDTDADPLGSGAPGRQVIMSRKGDLIQVAVDPTGTSENPDIDYRGRIVVFESKGDLTNTGSNAGGARQIFMLDRRGFLEQVTTGAGESRNAELSRKGRMMTFQSSSDPATGLDTGVSQVFAGRYDRLPATRITAGAGPSGNPAISDDGRIVAFESRADLAGSGADTGVPQIFVYDTRSETFAQVTSDAGGCTRPGAKRHLRDYRITFVCGGEAEYFLLVQNTRYHVDTGGGTTQAVLPELGTYFLTVSTTGDLSGGGTTTGYELYQLNDYVRPSAVMAGTATWFPYQGLK